MKKLIGSFVGYCIIANVRAWVICGLLHYRKYNAMGNQSIAMCKVFAAERGNSLPNEYF